MDNINIHDLKQEIQKEYGDDYVFDSDLDKTILAISDFRYKSGEIFIIANNKDESHLVQILSPPEIDNVTKFGIDVQLSDNGDTILILADKMVLVNDKIAERPIFIYKRDRYKKIYFEIDCIRPKFYSPDYSYGESALLSFDGNLVFVSAPTRLNDNSTECIGATGTVYTFKWSEKYEAYVQDCLVRPPHSDIIKFGDFIEYTDKGRLIVGDVDGNTYEYAYLHIDSPTYEYGWVFVN